MASNVYHIFWYLLSAFALLGYFSDSFAQQKKETLEKRPRWQIELLKDRYNYELAAPSETEKERYLTLLKNNQSVVFFIEGMMVKNSLPKMLRNLVMIESGFNNKSISSANASGIWQFTPIHAESCGMSGKDIRDPYKTTQAAAKTLKGLYAKYHNWITVVAAYNCGPTNTDKAIAKAGSRKYHEFYKYLPAETINHVRKFMVACYITNELEELVGDYQSSFSEVKKSKPRISRAPYRQVGDQTLVRTEISSDYNLDFVAQQIKVSREELKKWNPDLENDLSEYGTAAIYLPIEIMPNFLSQKKTILQRSLASKKPE
jgi:membrane-bound lytic murein transglycosylase D